MKLPARFFATLGLASAVALAAPASAASLFDGTWKVDIKSARMPDKPSIYLLKDGTYTCETCTPPLTVPADGKFHAVADRPYFDETAIIVVDKSSVHQVSRKAGKVVGDTTVTVSPDGNTAVFTFIDSSSPNGVPVTGKGMQQRVGPAPAGAHITSGSWKTTGYSELSDSGLAITMKLDGDMLSLSTPTGSSYIAKTDGTEAPVKGDPGWTSVTVKQTGPGTLVETDYRDGKPQTVLTMTVAPDGKAMSVLVQNKLRGTTSSYTATKL